MIGQHSEVVLFYEAKRLVFTRIVSKLVVGNTLCVPDGIDFKQKPPGSVLSYSIPPLEAYLRLPNRRLILVVRHGDHVVAALMGRDGMPFEAASYRWRRAVTVMAELKQRLQNAALVVSYERLRAAPEACLRDVAVFLGLDYEAGMLAADFSLLPDGESAGLEKEKFDLAKRYPAVWEKYLALCGHAASPREGGN
ncbi:MAG: hypothetical protein ALAOOOJD_01936 [bacterium]|nr:hypothetical protein [bacterium]